MVAGVQFPDLPGVHCACTSLAVSPLGHTVIHSSLPPCIFLLTLDTRTEAHIHTHRGLPYQKSKVVSLLNQ